MMLSLRDTFRKDNAVAHDWDQVSIKCAKSMPHIYQRRRCDFRTGEGGGGLDLVLKMNPVRLILANKCVLGHFHSF